MKNACSRVLWLLVLTLFLSGCDEKKGPPSPPPPKPPVGGGGSGGAQPVGPRPSSPSAAIPAIPDAPQIARPSVPQVGHGGNAGGAGPADTAPPDIAFFQPPRDTPVQNIPTFQGTNEEPIGTDTPEMIRDLTCYGSANLFAEALLHPAQLKVLHHRHSAFPSTINRQDITPTALSVMSVFRNAGHPIQSNSPGAPALFYYFLNKRNFGGFAAYYFYNELSQHCPNNRGLLQAWLSRYLQITQRFTTGDHIDSPRPYSQEASQQCANKFEQHKSDYSRIDFLSAKAYAIHESKGTLYNALRALVC